MNSETIRRSFIDFFRERGHLQLPSLSLVPHDPNVTTLFTIAGMQQMIPYFMGQDEPPNRRLLTVQKTVRTVDIDAVGDDTHLTFLEMLGNFSVGDYFKREAIAFTWEFLTKTMGIAPEKWWATIYEGDEEARAAWIAQGMPLDRIVETTDANWWSQGPTGPCGPDSEIHFDRGPEHGCGSSDCRPENDCCERFVETWNNVFMTYFREASGELRDLPWKNIDTGMGFERLVMIAQGAQSVYDTDLFQPIIRALTRLSGTEYRADAARDRSLRIIADHSRAIAFIIADGVMPSSEGRGYVLRRLLRRAALHGRFLGIERPFLTEPVEAAIDILGGYWTELVERRAHIIQVVQQEETRFLQTLSRGLGIFEEMAESAASDGAVIPGEEAFVLHDTYGFPLELTAELAQERGLSIDRAGFQQALQEQRERGRAGRKFSHSETSPETYAALAQRTEPTVFTGYDELQTPSAVTGIIAEGELVTRAVAGDEIELVLAATPFYAEAGGQVGDTGVIRGDNALLRVTDTQRPYAGVTVHKATVEVGAIEVGDVVQAEVDAERRLHILPHHSGTHLLHKALQEVLGPQATQAGSLVAPDRLRFDFRWPRPLTDEELREVQDRVNAAIWANLPVRARVEAYDDAVREGAMALFGEKYGDRVRVISMGNWSKELCGGTHVNATGDIGLLVITGESGIGSGVRRVEALAGAAAYAYINDMRDELYGVADALDTKPDSVVARAQQVVQHVRDLEKRIDALTQKLAMREAEALVRQGTAIDGFTVVADRIAAESKDYLEAATDAVRARLDRGIVVLGSLVQGSPAFTMAVTRDLRDRGFHANVILREAAKCARGGAGGSPEFAQGGGRDASKIDEVLQAAVDIIRHKAES